MQGTEPPAQGCACFMLCDSISWSATKGEGEGQTRHMNARDRGPPRDAPASMLCDCISWRRQMGREWGNRG